MSEELTDREIAELARLFASPQQAINLLTEAGFPSELVPSWSSDSGASFWRLVRGAMTDGVMHAGRTRLLDAARRHYPGNQIFTAPTATATSATHAGRDIFRTNVRTGDSGTVNIVERGTLYIGAPARSSDGQAGHEHPTLRVLFIGASPFDSELHRIRADREFKAIQEAAPPGLLWVGARPAAAAADLADVLDVRPDLLHLCCHSGAGELIFEDPEGNPHHVPVDTVVNRLRGYHDDADLALRGIVLSMCRSANIAARFTPLADTVIAWRDDLDDDCAVEFAGEFYRAAVRNNPPPTLRGAARIAAREVARSGPRENLVDQLVVLSVDQGRSGRYAALE